MKHLPRIAACAVSCSLASLTPVGAHGGVYVPPPNWGGPGDTVPPGGPAPSSPAGPAAPAPAGPSAGSPPSPSSPAAPNPGPATGAVAPRARIATGGGTPGVGVSTGFDGPDPTAWSTWWAFNRDPLLGLRDALESGRKAASGASGATVATRARPSDGAVITRALPVLLAALAQERNPDLVTAALLALAKVGPRLPDAEARSASAAIRARLGDPNQEVAETAAIALGVLAWAPDAALLAELLADAPAGRRAIGGSAGERSAVSRRTRAFAAYGLGVMADRSRNQDVRRFTVHHLARALGQEKGSTRDVHVAASIAFGIAPLPRAGATLEADGSAPAASALEPQVAFLSEVCADRRRDELTRAWAFVPLARLARAADEVTRAEALRLVSAPLRTGSNEPDCVRQGAAIATGILADGDGDAHDERARALLRSAGADGDRLARRLCWISLARSSARPGREGAHALASSRQWLGGELQRSTTQERPWFALALALGEREARDHGLERSRAVEELLEKSFRRNDGPTEAGAHALALALADVPRAGELLRARLAARPPDEVRAHCALALGLVGDLAAIEPLRELVLQSKYRPHLLREAAIGLGLAGDRGLSDQLLAMLREARGLTALSAAASALGWVGDESALDPLCAMVADRQLNDGARAFAAVALGLLCDPAPLPWNSPYAVDGQWWLAPPTLHEPLTSTGVLDLF